MEQIKKLPCAGKQAPAKINRGRCARIWKLEYSCHIRGRIHSFGAILFNTPLMSAVMVSSVVLILLMLVLLVLSFRLPRQ